MVGMRSNKLPTVWQPRASLPLHTYRLARRLGLGGIKESERQTNAARGGGNDQRRSTWSSPSQPVLRQLYRAWELPHLDRIPTTALSLLACSAFRNALTTTQPTASGYRSGART